MPKIVIKHATVYTMDGEDQPKALDILVEDGKIKALRSHIDCSDAREIDASGYIVLPGLIDAHCHIGIFETAIGALGVDGNEISSPATPELRAIDGINPFDAEFVHSYTHGVTTVATGQGSSNPIAGTFVEMKTYAKTFDEMIVKDPLAMKIAFGENPKTSFGDRKLAPVTRMATAAIIRSWLLKAKEYIGQKEEQAAQGKHHPIDLGLEALAKVIKKEIPLKAHAHRADDILTALRIAKEFNVDITLDHCSEGHLIPDQLGYAKGVIIGPLMGFPHKSEVKHQSAAAAKILHDHNVLFAIMSDLPSTHTIEIVRAAGECVKLGLPMIEGLKAITCNAAKILGLDQKVGSIREGLDADLVVFDLNPIEHLQSKCLMTMIDGTIIHTDPSFIV
ncbi:MAG: amidohydrolase family protein [Sphaerochaetaceae bacterium]|nr:amidohydrolase family protein [Sphaerochaetaceae bacterium]